MTPEGVKALRDAFEMTQKQFADALGVKINAVQRWENGKTIPIGNSIKALYKMENILLRRANQPKNRLK